MREPASGRVSTQEADPALLRRALDARPPDLDPAYEVLGKQYSISAWVSVIDHLARDTGSVDLELVAHRTLRRPPEIVFALLKLAKSTDTAQAAFLARVVSQVRVEEALRERATALNRDLAEPLDFEVLLAADDALGALYAVLARPLEHQAQYVNQIASSEELETLADVMRAEYIRLQEIARDTRWRSGSYRHALRHALADLALISGVGGLLEDRAYRLLQQRTEDPALNRELLSLMDSELRSRYLNWALERTSAESSPERALFALEEVERYRDDVGRATVSRLLASKNLQVAAAAASFLIRFDPSDRSDDLQIAELVASAGPEEQAGVIETIVESGADRLRIDLWPQATDGVIADRARGNRRVAERVTQTVRESSDPDVRARGLRLLGQIGGLDSDLEDVARDVVAAVLDGKTRDPEIDLVLDADWLRPALWASIPELPNPFRAHTLDGLLEREDPVIAIEALAAAHASTRGDVRGELEAYVLDAIASEGLSAQALADVQPQPLLDCLAPAASARVQSAQRELERLRPLIELGEDAAAAELEGLVAPLIERAMERSTGNEQLTRDYGELGSVLGRTDVAPEPVAAENGSDEAELATLTKTLAKGGVRISSDGDSIEVSINDGLGPAELVRAIALVDHRLSRAPSASAQATAQAVLLTLAAQLGEAGVAETILRDLFERGPTFQAALALTPNARTQLLDAARRTGFEPPAEWFQHPALGEWLAESDRQPTSAQEVTGVQLILALQQIERERRAAEARLDAGRIDARRTFAMAASKVFGDLEQTADAYIQLWLGLGRLGIRQVAALGQVLASDELDTLRHEIVGEGRGGRYVVRSSGLVVGDEVLRRARVEAVD